MNIKIYMNGVMFVGEVEAVEEGSTAKDNIYEETASESKPYADKSPSEVLLFPDDVYDFPVNDKSSDVAQEVEVARDEKVARSPKTGDKVYFLNLKAMTKKWVRNPQELSELGYTLSDVQGITDEEMSNYKLTL